MDWVKLFIDLMQHAKNNPVIITLLIFASLEGIKTIINYVNKKKQINNKDSLDYLQHITGLFEATKRQLEREREANKELHKCLTKERMKCIEEKQRFIYTNNLLRLCALQCEECEKLIERADNSYANETKEEDK